MEASGKLVEVIVIITNRGKGVEGDPFREVLLIYSKDGQFIAERDAWKDGTNESPVF